MSNIACPNCGYSYLRVEETDSRQEWCDETLSCDRCEKEYCLTTVFHPQSSRIASETLWGTNGNGLDIEIENW